MRLPVLKVLWGTFALPAMYPGDFFRATAWPLLALFALTLVQVSGAVAADDPGSYWFGIVMGYALFAWLAVRIHRFVLLGAEERRSLPVFLGPSFQYLTMLATAVAVKLVFFMGLMALVSLVSLLVQLPVGDSGAATGAAPLPTPPDPDVQRFINIAAFVAEIPLLYLLARMSTLLPTIALGSSWSTRVAWRQTRGNGWRLVVIVFLLPWAFDLAIDQAYRQTESAILVSVLAIARAVCLALGVIALSLAYRELTAAPEPPPTTPLA